MSHFVAPTTGVYMMDPFGDVYSVYVYTDIIHERRVGNMQVPLLRCVAVDRSGKRRGGMQAISFPTFGLFPLEIQEVGRGRRLLKRQSGSSRRGEVTVTLHLRPVER